MVRGHGERRGRDGKEEGGWEEEMGDVRLVAYEALLSFVNQLRYLSSIQGIHVSYFWL
jgi:hypothetical protein